MAITNWSNCIDYLVMQQHALLIVWFGYEWCLKRQPWDYHLLMPRASSRGVMVKPLGGRVKWGRHIHTHIQIVIVFESSRLGLIVLAVCNCVPPLLGLQLFFQNLFFFDQVSQVLNRHLFQVCFIALVCYVVLQISFWHLTDNAGIKFCKPSSFLLHD